MNNKAIKDRTDDADGNINVMILNIVNCRGDTVGTETGTSAGCVLEQVP